MQKGLELQSEGMSFNSWQVGKSFYQRVKENSTMKFALLALSTWFLGVAITGTCFMALAAYAR
jgi:hypothetical protein